MIRLLIISAMLAFSALAFAQDPDAIVIETDYSSPLSIVSGETEHDFTVELAQTREEITTGMMHRPEIAADVGMLFVREQKSLNGFWMRNTLVSLDILFLGDDGEILSIAHNAVPLSERSIRPGVAVKYILEIKGGQAGILGIQPGDKVRHDLLGNNG